MQDFKVNILGQEYEVYTRGYEDPKLQGNDGYVEPYSHKIILRNLDEEEKDRNCVEMLDEYRKKVLRHETVHAFFKESGLWENSDYATNEELTDWIAMQTPKMFKVFSEVGII